MLICREQFDFSAFLKHTMHWSTYDSSTQTNPDLPIPPVQLQLHQIHPPIIYSCSCFTLLTKLLWIFQDFRIPLHFPTTDAQSMPQPLHALPLPLVYTAASLQSSARAHTNLLLMTKQHWHASSTAPDSCVSQCKHMHVHMHQSVGEEVSHHVIL